MVGNDVVDLCDPGLNASPTRDRFDARIGRPAECEAIRTAADPARERWSHWAAKEAGYKLLRKRAPATIFSPIRFEVHLSAAGGASTSRLVEAGFERFGHVVHGDVRLELALSYRDGAIHALATASEEQAGELVFDLVRLDDRAAITPAHHSRAVRELALSRIAERLSVSPERLTIVKRDRIPEIRLDGRPIEADLSLSHHGHVVAFASRMPTSRQLERLAS